MPYQICESATILLIIVSLNAIKKNKLVWALLYYMLFTLHLIASFIKTILIFSLFLHYRTWIVGAGHTGVSHTNRSFI